jgi:hypothetical protein
MGSQSVTASHHHHMGNIQEHDSSQNRGGRDIVPNTCAHGDYFPASNTQNTSDLYDVTNRQSSSYISLQHNYLGDLHPNNSIHFESISDSYI